MKQLILSALLISFYYAAMAQIPKPPQNLPSPNVYAFTKYGNTPVNMFNGLPNIQVPLSMAKVGEFGLSASLSYDAAGFRPDVFPSWVGMNWNLNIGGVISRKVRGLPDEFNYTVPFISSAYGNQNYWFPNGFIARSNDNNFNEKNLMRTQSAIYTQKVCGGYVYRNGHILPYLADGAYYVAPQFPLYWAGGTTTGEHWMGVDDDLSTNNVIWGNEWTKNRSLDDHSGGIQDLYPDEFTFNAFGVSGKFYFKKHGPFSSSDNSDEIFAIQCNQKIRILPFFDSEDDTTGLKLYNIPLSPNMCGDQATSTQVYSNYSAWHRGGRYPKVLTGFQIITEDGTKLTFGKDIIKTATSLEYFKSLPIEFSANLYSCTDYWTADSWHLSTVTLSNGKSLYIEYERDGFIASKYIAAGDQKIDAGLAICSQGEFGVGLKGGRVISPVYMSRIYGEGFNWQIKKSESSQLAMDFDYFSNIAFYGSTQLTDFTYNKRYKVDSIIFNNGGLITKAIFNYNNGSSERLQLSNVTLSGIDPSLQNNEVYHFDYIHDVNQPGYLTSQTDHWGFWNGITTEPSTDETAYYNGREPSLFYTKQGMLNKISYPTGGTTTFVYESNNYSKAVQTNGTSLDIQSYNSICGGLRIKEIIDADGVTSVVNKKRYYYIPNFTSDLSNVHIESSLSSGILNSKIQYFWYSNSTANARSYNTTYSSGSSCSPSILNVTAELRAFSSQPLYYLNDNYHVGYTTVVEVDDQNAYTKYEYTNHDNGFSNDSYLYSFNSAFESPFNKVSSKAFERGRLKGKKIYSSTNVLLKESTTSYVRKLFTDNEKNLHSLWDGTVIYSGGCGSGSAPLFSSYKWAMLGNQYSFFTYQLLPSIEKEITYDPANSAAKIENTVSYSYESDLHFFPTKVTNTTSGGQEKVTILKYAHEYPSVWMYSHIVQNKPRTVVETISLLKDANNSYKVLSGILNEYALSVATMMPYLNSVYQLDVNTPFDYSNLTATVPITRNMNTTGYSKDSRYTEVYRVNTYDEFYSALDVKQNTGDCHYVVRGNLGNNMIALTKGKESEFGISWMQHAYTSFEDYIYYDEEGYSVIEKDNSNFFIYNGNTQEEPFSGKKSFSGTVKSKGFVHSAKVIVLAKKGGNTPLLQSVQGTNVSTGVPFTLIGESGDWNIYEASHSNGGTQVQINSNGNIIDELRVLPSNSKALMTTYTYYNDLISSIVDPNFKCLHYEYDGLGRLMLIRDQDGRIIKKYCYNFSGQSEQCN